MTAIYISQGQARYVGGTVTETTGKDITGATFVVGLSTDPNTLPDEWVTPDVNTEGATVANRIIKVLISDNPPSGLTLVAGTAYNCWIDVTDNPEIEPQLAQWFQTA